MMIRSKLNNYDYNQNPADHVSPLLQFLYQELLGEEDHDKAKVDLLEFFRDSQQVDEEHLNFLSTCFDKATLDTKAFGVNQISPQEFSQRLVHELAKKFEETQELNRRLSDIEESYMAVDTSSTLPLDDAISHHHEVRESSSNLEEAMVYMSQENIKNRSRLAMSSNARYSGFYDEQMLALRKKINESKLLWGTDGVAEQLGSSGLFPYVPLNIEAYGYPEIVYGTSETNVQGSWAISGTIIGLRCSPKNHFHQKLMWDSYTALMELNTIFPSRLFPLPLSVSRDNNSTTFSFEYPAAPSSLNSLKSKISGCSLLRPLTSFLYTGVVEGRTVLSRALRHYSEVLEAWCAQFGQAYRALRHFSHIQYDFGNCDGGDFELSPDTFIREDGFLVLSNAVVMTDVESMDANNTDSFSRATLRIISECLGISRSIAVQLRPTHSAMALDDESEPEYMARIDDVIGTKGVSKRSHSLPLSRETSEDNSTSIYLEEGCGLDIFPLISPGSEFISESSSLILVEETSNANRNTLCDENTMDHDSVINKFLASPSNVVVTFASADAKVISVIGTDGLEKGSSDGGSSSEQKVFKWQGKMRGQTGFSFRVKARSPGIAFLTVRMRAAPGSSSCWDRDGKSSIKMPLLSFVLKINVMQYSSSKSSAVRELIAFVESSFWTPLHKTPNELYIDDIFNAKVFQRRLSDIDSSKVLRQWQEIRNVVNDYSKHDSFEGDINQAYKDADERDINPDDRNKAIDAKDEFVVNELLKSNKLYNEKKPPEADDLVQSLHMTRSLKHSSNASLRWPQNTYCRKPTGVEARSMRRPPGEKGWK